MQCDAIKLTYTTNIFLLLLHNINNTNNINNNNNNKYKSSNNKPHFCFVSYC